MTRQPATHCRIGVGHKEGHGYFAWVQEIHRVRGEDVNGEVHIARRPVVATRSTALAWARQEAARRGLTIIGKYAKEA